MGGVVISPNVQRTKQMIDVNGNQIDPKTKQVISQVDVPYVPTKEEIETMVNKPTAQEIDMVEQATGPIVTKTESENPLAAAIKKQVELQVQEAMKKVDISKMIADAVQEAFK